MILSAPRSIVQFCRGLARLDLVSVRIARALPTFLSTFILERGKRTLSALGRFVFSGVLDKSTVSRIFGDGNFRSRDLYRAAFTQAVLDAVERCPPLVIFTWLLAIDATSTKRGGFTHILGANKFKPKVPGTKGRSTKAHSFLMGILITHFGLRFPVPRYTCYPKKYRGPGQGRKHLTQIDLAVLMIQDLLKLLPGHIQLVVVADEAFEGKKLSNLARRLRGRIVLITPVATSRCFAEDTTPSTSNGDCLCAYGRRCRRSTFQRLDLRRGSEKTVSYRRYSSRKPGPKDYRTYSVRHERRTVAGLGTVGVVYSWKSPVYEPRKTFDEETFKVLLCSDPSLSGPEVVEWYELRWTAIEILFRELKQELGLADYVGQDLQAFERHVDLSLLSLLFLETMRLDVLEDASTPPAVRAHALTARTRGMTDLVRHEVNREFWDQCLQAPTSVRKQRVLRRFLTRLHKTCPSGGGDTATCAA